MKQATKAIVVKFLGWQVRRLRKKANPRIVAVAGSVGKTSTKHAIAKVLSQRFRVRTQAGNYNDIVTVPLVFFGKTNPPNVLNPLAWLRLLISNEIQLRRDYPYDLVVLELAPGGSSMADFAQYLSVDLAVITAITPEHMEYYDSLEAVAEEEKSVAGFSKVVLINSDMCDEKYLAFGRKDIFTYGLKTGDYRLQPDKFTGEGYNFSFAYDGKSLLSAFHPSIAESQLHAICAGLAVGHRFNLTSKELTAGLSQITSVEGRMNKLNGIKDSTILDDTYNASPEAVKAALDTLYKLPAPQKIAILGNMNELGKLSPESHTAIGEYCDPRQLDLVVTIGHDANKFLAGAAEKRGCTVRRFDNPVAAGLYVKDQLKAKAIVLAKGSQNGVFAEEAVKQLLASQKNVRHLVRQSPYWLNRKRKQFTNVVGPA